MKIFWPSASQTAGTKGAVILPQRKTKVSEQLSNKILLHWQAEEKLNTEQIRRY